MNEKLIRTAFILKGKPILSLLINLMYLDEYKYES